jgi:hypothetical protein
MYPIAAVLLAVATGCSVPPSETALQATLAYEDFDGRNGPYGWRTLSAGGCADAAAALLAAYAAANQGRLTLEQRLELAFHSGQALAFAGRDREAIPYFEQASSADATPEWQVYVAATLAFLKHDARALAEARERYAAIAPGSMRLGIIDGFIACPDLPYAKAAHCGM